MKKLIGARLGELPVDVSLMLRYCRGFLKIEDEMPKTVTGIDVLIVGELHSCSLSCGMGRVLSILVTWSGFGLIPFDLRPTILLNDRGHQRQCLQTMSTFQDFWAMLGKPGSARTP